MTHRVRRPRLGAVAVLAVAALTLPAIARGDSPPDEGVAFNPTSASLPRYGTRSPSEDPDRQRHFVEAHDGTDLYVETWLPAPSNGNIPPERVPTILVVTPYVPEGEQEYAYEEPFLVDHFTARGYAVAQHHVRGNEESGGCMEQTAANQIDGVARVIEYLGRDAPWADGNVGTYGISYDAESQVSVAGLGDPERTKYLKAIVPVSSAGGLYEWHYADGVPWAVEAPTNATYWAASLVPGNRVEPGHSPERLPCGPSEAAQGANIQGNYNDYWADREFRPGAPDVKAATLLAHGLRDFNVQTVALAGWFSALPDSTPHKAVLPVSDHAFPNHHSWVEPDWERTDWFEMLTAWYDRYLKGIDTGVESWPDVQVQDNLGQWWATDEFPFTGGPPAQLALGPNGTLGTTSPSGSTTYVEQLHLGPALPVQQAVFETPVVDAPLHITGMPVLDLWLRLDRPDAHVSAALEVIGADGRPMIHQEQMDYPVAMSQQPAATFGARSMQHLAPMTRGWFEQRAPVAPPVGEAFQASIRLFPTELVVPVGGRLRLTLAGSVTFDGTIGYRKAVPSGTATAVTVLHDCSRPSALRFLMPSPDTQKLNVREKDETAELASAPALAGWRDGAGLATSDVCGRPPVVTPLLRDGREEAPPPSTAVAPRLGLLGR